MADFGARVTVGRSWSLMDGDRLLGVLTVVAFNQPWLNARLAPAPAFEQWRPVFQKELRLLDRIDEDVDAWEAAYDAIASALTLRDPDGDDIDEFLLHIDGDEAWWRWI